MAEKRYVVGGHDGWLNVKREPSGAIIAMPEYLQVSLSESKEGRDYFTPLEGVERGKKFSVKTGNLRSANLAHYHSGAHLEFSLSKEKLTYQGNQAKAVTDTAFPIELGQHRIQIPDFPHDKAIGYRADSPYVKTWFFLGNGVARHGSDDRYLHPGGNSLGCITVKPSEWTRLYQYLILCRSNDGKTVGNVLVVR